MVNNVYLCLSFKHFYTIMKQFIISATLALCAMSLSAQTKQLTLEDAMNSGRIIRMRYPNIDLEALDQDTAMPYEDANTKETADTNEGTFFLQFTNAKRVWRYMPHEATTTSSTERAVNVASWAKDCLNPR